MELMAFHSTVRKDEVEAFRKISIEHELPVEKIQDWRFSAHDLTSVHTTYQQNDALASLTHQMSKKLKYGESYNILDHNLIHYILIVRRNYRPVPYHNFGHAGTYPF